MKDHVPTTLPRPPDTTEFHGVALREAAAWWCDCCGCLLVLDISDGGQPVADRFEYASLPDDRTAPAHEVCACHAAVTAHNAAEVS